MGTVWDLKKTEERRFPIGVGSSWKSDVTVCPSITGPFSRASATRENKVGKGSVPVTKKR